jgi:hypothetical protein
MSKLSIELPITYSGYSVMDFGALFGQRRGYVFREKFVKSPSPAPTPSAFFFWSHLVSNFDLVTTIDVAVGFC